MKALQAVDIRHDGLLYYFLLLLSGPVGLKSKILNQNQRTMKLGKVLLFLVIAVVAYFIFKKFYPGAQSDNSMQVFGNSTKDANENVAVASVETKNAGSAKPKSRSFIYSPEKPQNGKVKGVV